MHRYSTSTTERTRIPIALFAASVLIAAGVQELLVRNGVSVPWWLSFPSIGGFYAGLIFLFDRLMWRWPIVRAVLQVKIPVPHGEWTGLVRPASGDKVEIRPATLFIDQHWSRINVSLSTDRSESRSTMATIRDEHTSRPSIQYVYDNRPRESAVVTMHQHSETAALTLNRGSDEDVLAGGYYTGRDRGSTGELEFRRK